MSSTLAFVLVMSAVSALTAAVCYYRLPTGRHAATKGAAVTVASLYADAARRRAREAANPWPPSRGVLPGHHEPPSWWPAFVRPYVADCAGQCERPAPGAGAGLSASS